MCNATTSNKHENTCKQKTINTKSKNAYRRFKQSNDM